MFILTQLNSTSFKLHSINKHGEEYGHIQAETLLVTDSQSESEGEKEKREKKDSIVQALGKVTVCKAKTKCRSPGKPTQRPPDKHW